MVSRSSRPACGPTVTLCILADVFRPTPTPEPPGSRLGERNEACTGWHGGPDHLSSKSRATGTARAGGTIINPVTPIPHRMLPLPRTYLFLRYISHFQHIHKERQTSRLNPSRESPHTPDHPVYERAGPQGSCQNPVFG